MVINVSAFVEDEAMKKDLNRWANIRNTTLDICYAIPGYTDLELEQKNKVYDAVKKEVEKIIQ